MKLILSFLKTLFHVSILFVLLCCGWDKALEHDYDQKQSRERDQGAHRKVHDAYRIKLGLECHS